MFLFLRRSLLIGFGVAWSLIALEIAVRLFLPPLQDRLSESPPILVWTHRRNAAVRIATPEFSLPVHTNRLGLVDDETPYEKPPGVYRILLLGDSYTEALQVPQAETFQALLEEALNAGGGEARFEVLNPRYVYASPPAADIQAAWTLTDALIQRLAGEVTADGSRFAIVYMPEREQVDPAFWQASTGQTTFDAPGWNADAPNDGLAQIAARLNAPFLNPLGDFRSEFQRTGEPLFWSIDIHLTAAGHQQRARSIERFLTP